MYYVFKVTQYFVLTVKTFKILLETPVIFYVVYEI